MKGWRLGLAAGVDVCDQLYLFTQPYATRMGHGSCCTRILFPSSNPPQSHAATRSCCQWVCPFCYINPSLVWNGLGLESMTQHSLHSTDATGASSLIRLDCI